MSVKYVIARFNENITWLDDISNDCIIYNKGEPLNIPNEILRENVGRESDVYLHYIITNYNHLPDVVVFSQAKLVDHYFRSDDIKHLTQLKDQAFYYDKSLPKVSHFTRTSDFFCWDPEWNFRELFYNKKENYKHVKITFWDWFTKNVSEKYPNPIKIYHNAVFAVKKELILQHPITYYENLINQVNHHINPMEGHFFERSWYYVFPSAKDANYTTLDPSILKN